MTLFEYLTVAISIVLALGATHLLANLRSVFDRRRRHWVHVLFVIFVLGLYPNLWWSFWDFSNGANWSIYTFLYSLLGPGLLYMMATTLIPIKDTGLTAWIDHFLEIRSWFYILNLLYITWAYFTTVLLLDAPIFHSYRLIQLAAFLAALAGLTLAREAVDKVVIVVFFAVLAIANILRAQPAPWWA